MNDYNCPHCKAYLNVNGYVALAVRKNHGHSGVILMSEELGDYTSFLNSNLKCNEGEITFFHCPCCSKSLQLNKDERLVKILKTNSKNEETIVIFSAICGTKSTYHISEERQKTFGENAMEFIDPEWYLKT